MIPVEGWQGNNSMGLSDSLSDFKKTILSKHEIFTKTLKMKHKNSRDGTNGSFCPLGRLFYQKKENHQNIDKKTMIYFC